MSIANGKTVLDRSYDIPASGAYYVPRKSVVDPTFSLWLPGPGTYLIHCDVRLYAAVSGGGGLINVALLDGSFASNPYPASWPPIADSERALWFDPTGSGDPVTLTAPLTFPYTTSDTSPVVHFAARRVDLSPCTWLASQITSDANGRTAMSYIQL